STQTEFNGTKLLDGSFTGKAFQVGANAGQLITVNAVTNAQTSSLGEGKFAADVTGAAVTDVATTGLTINNVAIADVGIQGSVPEKGAALVAAINERSGDTGVYATFDTGSSTIKIESLVADRDLVIGGTPAGSGLSAATTAASGSTAVQVD